jgi:hypothetical protein
LLSPARGLLGDLLKLHRGQLRAEVFPLFFHHRRISSVPVEDPNELVLTTVYTSIASGLDISIIVAI